MARGPAGLELTYNSVLPFGKPLFPTQAMLGLRKTKVWQRLQSLHFPHRQEDHPPLLQQPQSHQAGAAERELPAAPGAERRPCVLRARPPPWPACSRVMGPEALTGPAWPACDWAMSSEPPGSRQPCEPGSGIIGNTGSLPAGGVLLGCPGHGGSELRAVQTCAPLTDISQSCGEGLS